MPTFSNSPIPHKPLPAVPVDEATSPQEAVSEAPTAETAVSAPLPEETPATETATEANEGEALAAESPAEGPATAAPTTAAPAPESPKPTEPPMPWAIVIRHFAQAPDEACRKLNADFSLTLTPHTYKRLQKLSRTVLNRDPTVGELCILDGVDRAGYGHPHREAVGELYTNSSTIAETWADMMAKHSELFAASGLLHKASRTPPPCTLEEALTLVGRYLYRTGRVTPLTDGLPFGGKNSDGRTAVLCSPAQEADAIAEGYTPVRKVDLGGIARSVWTRRGPAMAITPERSGDFLVSLRAPDPAALMAVLEKERGKRRPAVGAIAALSRLSPLETVMTLCEGADLYPARLPRTEGEPTDGPVDLLRLCRRPALTPDTHPDYLLRVPADKVRELSEMLRDAGIVAVSVGQVRSGGKIRVLLRQGAKDIPVATLPATVIRTYPSISLYRREVEDAPAEETGVTPASVSLLPEQGLLMASSAVTVTQTGTGYAAAKEAVATAISPLTEGGVSTRDIRLSVALTAADGEDAHGNRTLEVLCGLYRAAAEGGMAVEDPDFTVSSPAEGQAPAVSLSVVAYRRA